MLEAVAYAIVAGAYALTALALAARSGRRAEGAMLAGACAAIAAWAGLSALADWNVLTPTAALLAELVRNLGVLLLLLGLLQLLAAGRLRHLWRDGKFAFAIGLFALGLADQFGLSPHALLPVGLVVRIGLAILGLALVENTFARAEESARWSHKHLLLGLALIFLFDLVLYSDAYLFHQLNPTLALARPFIQLIALPLLLVSAARAEAVPIRLRLSQQAAFQATTLLGCGLYLLVMAALGYAIRDYDLPFGPLLLVLLLAIAALALMVLLLSRQVRARLRRLVAENFFHLRYDYRTEWLRFIETMASAADRDPLHVRVVRAFADVFDCSSGALYLRERDGDHALAGRWRWAEIEALPVLPAALVATVAQRARLFDLRPLLAEESGEAELRGFLAHLSEPWLAAPILLREEVIGVVLLGEPRAMRALTWEDEDLAFILGVQVGSYIAEDRAMRALMQAQQFERLSKRFSFVAHDLKNIVSQLSVMVENAKRHKDNPEFVADAFTTVGLSVEKMRHMLARLRQESEPGESGEVFDAAALVETLVADRRRAFAGLEAGPLARDLPVALPRERLIAVLDNLIQNAADASAGRAQIRVSCQLAAADWVAIEVADDGPGMTPDFVRARLFEPFRSTKSGGYGLGLYHSREVIEQHGGQLRIETMPGKGTKVRILLPLAAAPVSQDSVQSPGRVAAHSSDLAR